MSGHYRTEIVNDSSFLGVVIVMTFWYVFIGTDLLFSNFLKLYPSLGIDHDPHVPYVHMTYVYSFSHVSFLHTITWPREVIIVL